MSVKPLFASGWNTTLVPTSQLRQELQNVYRLLGAATAVQQVLHGDDPIAARPDTRAVYWVGEAQPQNAQLADLWLAPSNGALQVFDGTTWH